MLIHIIMEILENIIKLIYYYVYYTMFILCTVMYSYDNSQSIYQDKDLVYLDTLDNKIIFFSYFSSSFLILLV